jgi:hypothetical protein
MAGFTVAISADGREWFDAGVFRVPADHKGHSRDKPVPEPFRLDLEKPAVARFVRICAKKNPNRHQMVLGEIAVWGDVARGDNCIPPSESRPGVHPCLHGIGSASLAVEWNDYAISGVKGFRVYASDAPFRNVCDDGVESIGATGANEKRFIVCPLKSKATRHYAVAPFFADGVVSAVESVPYAPPGPLDVSRFGDLLCVNHFYDGGGAREGVSPVYWNDVVLDILAKTPFKAIRWWIHPDRTVRKYLDRGIEVTSWARDIPAACELGVRLLDFGNEPHLAGTAPEKFAEDCIAKRAKCEKAGGTADAGFAYYGPTVGIEDASIDYLDRFLAAGGGDVCDAFDFHTYVGVTAEFVQPSGYPKGAPEAIPARVAKVRAVLEKYGQGAKPMMCSEWGYSDCRIHNAHGDITPLVKSQFLVRGSIIHFVLGFRRLFLYSFYDEGTDSGNPEHFFGLVSRDLQKKPAFYAMQTLGEVLGDTMLSKRGSPPAGGSPDGDYGYVFRKVAADGTPTNGYVSVFWNGARERTGLFRTKPGEVVIVSMLGERRTIRTADDGTFRVRFGASPVYLRAAAPVALVESKDVEEPLREGRTSARPQTAGTPVFSVISLSSTDGEVAVRTAGGKQSLAFDIGNIKGGKINVRLTLRDSGGGIVASKTVEASATLPRNKVAFVVDPGLFRLQSYTLSADYEADGESRREECSVWLRVVGLATGGASRISSVRFAGLDDPVLALESDELEVTLLPRHGGEILEIIDKRTLKNQVALDYEDLPRLASIPYANGIFDTLQVRGANVRAGFGRNTPFSAVPSADGSLCMTAKLGGGIAATKTFRLENNRLSWKTAVSNGTSTQVTVDWHLHPEYVPGGTADSYADIIVVPKSDGLFEMPFWAGLGERRIGDVSEGWWELRDTVAKYVVRQEFDLAAIPALRLWYGAAAMNIELLVLGRSLPSGESVFFQTSWTFKEKTK